MGISRRKFLQVNLLSIFIIHAIAVKNSKLLPLSLNTANAKDNHKFISIEDPVAKALSYSEDSKKVNPALKIEKDGTAGSKQFCSNCKLYIADKTIPDGGKCQILTNGYVKAQGWCKSWNLKKLKF